MLEQNRERRKLHIHPVRDLRNNYTEIAKKIANHAPVVITNNGRGTAVLINIDDYSDYESYLYEKYAISKLEEAERYAAGSDAEWLDFDDVKGEKRGTLLDSLQNKDSKNRG